MGPKAHVNRSTSRRPLETDLVAAAPQLIALDVELEVGKPDQSLCLHGVFRARKGPAPIRRTKTPSPFMLGEDRGF
jgi:hypothetical protein